MPAMLYREDMCVRVIPRTLALPLLPLTIIVRCAWLSGQAVAVILDCSLPKAGMRRWIASSCIPLLASASPPVLCEISARCSHRQISSTSPRSPAFPGLAFPSEILVHRVWSLNLVKQGTGRGEESLIVVCSRSSPRVLAIKMPACCGQRP